MYKQTILSELTRGSERLEDIPVHFTIYKGEAIQFETNIPTDKAGTATLILNKDQIKRSGKLVLRAFIDVPALLNIEPDSEFCKKVLLEYPPYQMQAKVEVIAPTVYMKSQELNHGNEMEIPLLAPAIKNVLVEMDYKFVEIEEGADYTIEIEATTRKGQNTQYMFFSYLDATIAMHQNSTDKEIYKNGLSSVKGGGSSYELASVKAYEKAISSFIKDFISELGH